MHLSPIKKCLIAAVISGTSFASSSASEGGYWQGEHALGNFLGIRDSLEAAGVTFFGSYEANIGGNPVGGRERGVAYSDNFDFGLRFDLEKLVGWDGATFTVQGVQRDGTSLTNDYVGNFYQVQQNFGVQTTMLYGVYFEQKFLDDRASLKFGRFATNDDFATSPIYGLYMGNAIDGNPKSLVSSGAFTSYPGSSWAARFKYETSAETNVSLGVYQNTDTVYDEGKHGLDWSMRGNDGVMFIGQVGWTPEFFRKPVASGTTADGKSAKAVQPTTEMKGLPGHYWLGMYYSTWETRAFDSDELQDGKYGFYVHADQMVYQESPGSDQGLTLWTAAVYQPDERVNIIPFQINGGLVYKGLLPGREADSTILGLSYGSFSKDYAREERKAGRGNPDYEFVVEAGHRIQLTKFAYVMPELQWIINPAGTGQVDDALVVGLRIGITF